MSEYGTYKVKHDNVQSTSSTSTYEQDMNKAQQHSLKVMKVLLRVSMLLAVSAILISAIVMLMAQTTISNSDKQIQILLTKRSPIDCSDALPSDNICGGVVTIFPHGENSTGYDVFCDDEWTVIQRRIDGSISFDRTYREYQDGFGSPYTEYWIGLNKIRNLTASDQYELRVKMEDKQGETAEARYSNFSIGPNSDDYRLSVGGYSGTAGDALDYKSEYYRHNQKTFTTPDHRGHIGNTCGDVYNSGWWFTSFCFYTNPNGVYTGTGRHGISWYPWKKSHDNLISISMMIKRKSDRK